MNNHVLPDTPWHVGYAKKKEDDPRRHKARCVYNEDGTCKVRNGKCIGSAHCTSYDEEVNGKIRQAAQVISRKNAPWTSEKIRAFCSDSSHEIKRTLLKDIKTCPICGGAVESYKPLRFLAKECKYCKVLFVNADVYVTYMEDVNKNIANYFLCLVGYKSSKNK